MRAVFKVILSFIVIYLLFMGILYLIQRQYIYFPQTGDIRPAKWGLPEVKLIQLKTTDGLLLNAWYHPAKDHKMPTILYLQGNYGHIGHRAVTVDAYIKAGYGMLLLGYRGYSGNKGQPSEKGLYLDARAAISFLKSQGVYMHCIVLFGESLGTGVAVQMATEFHVGAVILESAYTSMVDVGKKHYPFLPVRWLLKDRFESIRKIHKIQAPLFIIHGENDNIIPVGLGERLYEKASQPKAMKIYPGAGHNDLPDVSPNVIQFLKKHQICLK